MVIERLDAKQALYRRIDAVRRPGTAVSSNTSTIPLDALIEGMPDAFAKDFLITHFFNPPRYMRLLEVVTGPKTDPALAATVTDFADRRLGKSVVACKDRPGFIANRLGIFWIQNAIAAADDLGVPVEEADAIMGRPFGIPKTGVFGLVDLVGLDLIPHTTKSLRAALPAEDAFHATYREMPLITKLIAEGHTGRKGKGGFYRLNRTNGQKTKEAVDLVTGAYRPSAKADLPELKEAKGPRAVLDLNGRVGAYAWTVIGPTLAYAAGLVGEASDEIAAIDEAMRLGYNWKWGPFELIDKIGGAMWPSGWQGRAPVPPILAGLDGKTFYPRRERRAAGPHGRGRLQNNRAPRGRAAAGGHQACREAAPQERLGRPVGHRRRRGVLRVHLAGERAGRTDHDPARQDDQARQVAVQGARGL